MSEQLERLGRERGLIAASDDLRAAPRWCPECSLVVLLPEQRLCPACVCVAAEEDAQRQQEHVARWERIEVAAVAILGSGCTVRAALETAEELIAEIDRRKAAEEGKMPSG